MDTKEWRRLQLRRPNPPPAVTSTNPLAVTDNKNVPVNIKTTVMQHDDEQQNIEDIDKERNIEENINIGFLTARGTSINVSKQALFKAKRLFADAFDTDEARTSELFAKKRSNEEKNRSSLSFSSFATNVFVNHANQVIVKPKSFTKHVKTYDKRHTTNRKKLFTNKNPIKKASTVSMLFSTVGGAPINIPKEALSKAKTLLADESENADDNVLIKYSETSLTDKNCTTVNKSPSEKVDDVPILFSTAGGAPINISKEALLKAKTLLADESESTGGNNVVIKHFKRSPASKNRTVKNICRPSFVRNKPINISKKSPPIIKTVFAKHANSAEFTVKNKNNISDNEQRDSNNHKPKIPNESLDTCNNEGAKNVTDAVLDSLNTSMQKLCCTASINNMSDVCSDTFDNDKTIKTTVMQYDDEQQNIEDIDKEKNIEENININFLTARGTSINVSKQALFKAKRLFADAFDTDEARTSELFAKRRSNEEKNRSSLSSSSFATNVSVNHANQVVVKPKPFTKHVKTYNKRHTTNRKKLFTNKNPSIKVNTVPMLFSTTDGAPINISKEALLKAKTLLANESKNTDDNVLIKYSETSLTDKNCTTVNKSPSEEADDVPILFSTAGGAPINISKEALLKAKTLLADESESTGDNNVVIKHFEKSFTSKNMTVKNMCRPSFVHNKPIDISKKSPPIIKTVFAEHANSAKFTVKNKNNISDNEQRDSKDHEPKIPNESLDTCNNESVENVTDAVFNSLNTSMQALCCTASFNNINDVCSDDTFDNDKTIKTTAMQYDDEQQNIEDIDKERNVGKNKNIDFFITRDTSTNVSKQALFKAKSLFASDAFKFNVSEDVSILRLETPLSSLDSSNTIMSTMAAVHSSTSLSLLPFSNKTNQQHWSSDMLKTSQQTQICTKPMTDDGSRVKTKERRRLQLRRPNPPPAVTSTDPLAVTDNENIPVNVKTTVMQYDDEQQNIEDIDKGRNIKENINIGFSTARGTSINISKQALFKAKRLFAGTFDTDEARTSELFAKKTSNEEKNRSSLSSSSFATNVSVNRANQVVVKSKPFTEHIKTYDKRHTTNRKKLFTNKNPSKKASTVSMLFSTVDGAPINISKEALSKANTLLADESENTDDNALIKYSETLLTDKNCTTVNKSPSEKVDDVPILFSTANGAPINISKEAVLKAKTLLADESENTNDNALIKYSKTSLADKNCATVNKSPSEEVDDVAILFSTAGGAPINISKEALLKAKTLLVDKSENTDGNNNVVIKHFEKSFVSKNMTVKNMCQPFFVRNKLIDISKKSPPTIKTVFTEHANSAKFTIKNKNDISDIEQRDINFLNIGFSTTRDTPVNSKRATFKTKTLFAEHVNDLLQDIHNNDNELKRQETRVSKVGFQTANGKAINISKQALSRATAVFAEHLDTTLKTTVTKKTNIHDAKMKGLEAKMAIITIQSARNIVDISKERPKAKISFKHVDAQPEPVCAKTTKIDTKIKSRPEIKRPTQGGFQTACGTFINISEHALSRAKAVFADQVDCFIEMDRPEKNTRDNGRKIKKPDLIQLPHGGLQTANGQQVPVLNMTVVQARDVVSRDYLDEKTSDLGHVSSQKHKLSETTVDKSTPQGRTCAFETKKARLSNNIPAKNVFETTALQENRIQKATICEKREDANINTQKPTQVVNERAKGGSTDVNDYGAIQMTMAYINDTKKILKARWTAALEKQEARIIAKQKHRSKHVVGHLYLYKQTMSTVRLSLMDISGGKPPVLRSSQELHARRISPSILDITATNAATYRLRCSDFYETGAAMVCNNVCTIIEMEDNGTCLIADENGDAGVEEFHRAFLASTGVDPTLIPAGWVENHYRWIVWKLASMDRRRFGSTDLPRVLTPLYIMAQLKYRYDREIDRFERPALRRILEKDDAAYKRMILCVSSIVQSDQGIHNGTEPKEIDQGILKDTKGRKENKRPTPKAKCKAADDAKKRTTPKQRTTPSSGQRQRSGRRQASDNAKAANNEKQQLRSTTSILLHARASRKQRSLRATMRAVLLIPRATTQATLDNVRVALETRHSDSETELLENVVTEREFPFGEIDEGLFSNDPIDRTDEKPRRSRPYVSRTPSRVSSRREFSLTSYESDTFDPSEYYRENGGETRMERPLLEERTHTNQPQAQVKEIEMAQSQSDAQYAPLSTETHDVREIYNLLREMQKMQEESRMKMRDETRELRERLITLENSARNGDQVGAGNGRYSSKNYGRTEHNIRNRRSSIPNSITLKEARSMIPEFDGTSRQKLQEFINACTYAVHNIQPTDEESLVQAILYTKLKGKAMQDFETQDIQTFAQLKQQLEDCYQAKQSTTHLQIEFNTLKQEPNESAHAFGQRVDLLAMKLYDAMIEGEDHSSMFKRAIQQTIQKQALINFQIGLRDELKILVRSQNNATLQEAITGASAEEKLIGPTTTKTGASLYKNKPGYTRQPQNQSVQCFKCGKTGHYGRECRSQGNALPKPSKG
ncbi:uncharacterized protein LOC112467669 [Temnothorax curvispinosus]|uniref:Uncharacterized protein LOC112467669 n=1 Tax=Temnothorax curvispinosus TaxID=300111 RepID=A0A6J1RH50_9HYME|nr:uncharacterized protein LOC112467669 [Temnothorax curvispinosus]